jgi:RNA polymerase sigma-70 factor (ECF subfamily)
MIRTDPDRALARKAHSGDRRALEQLYERHRNRLMGFLVRAAGNRDLAEDAFQEVWIKVIRGIGSFDPDRGAFRTWLFRVARNATVDLLRRERHRRAPSLNRPVGETGTEAIELVGSSSPGPDRRSDGRRMVVELEGALGGLDERQRAAILLRHQQGLTYAEVAEALDVPEGTAKTLIHRGVQALRRTLEG